VELRANADDLKRRNHFLPARNGSLLSWLPIY